MSQPLLLASSSKRGSSERIEDLTQEEIVTEVAVMGEGCDKMYI